MKRMHLKQRTKHLKRENTNLKSKINGLGSDLKQKVSQGNTKK